MKISSMNFVQTNTVYQLKQKLYINYPICTQYTDSVSFGFANAGGLKNLLRYDIQDMYSSRILIDPIKFQKMSNLHVFSASANTAISALKEFKRGMIEKEGKVFKLMQLKTLQHGDYYNLHELMQDITPFYEKFLVRKQKPVIKELEGFTSRLPKDCQTSYLALINKTYDILDKKPIVLQFSTTDFQYKLSKIKDDIYKKGNIDSKYVIDRMLHIIEHLSEHTNEDTIENQKKIINYLNIILNKSELKNNEQLKNLISSSLDRLNDKPCLIHFSRKSFIYDLMRAIDSVPNDELKEQILNTAKNLPTSSNNFAAYVVKISQESSDKIAYRLCWPGFGSIEHLDAKSCGGANVIENYGLASTIENSLRQNIPFIEQLKRRPKTQKYCQKQMYQFLKLREKGILEKTHTKYSYPEDYAHTLYMLSDGKIKLKIKLPWYIKIFNNIKG